MLAPFEFSTPLFSAAGTGSVHGHIAPPAHDGADLVQLYLNDILRHALLSKDDEIGLAQRIEAGADARRQLGGEAASTPADRRELTRRVRNGEEARRTFVEANLRLVVSSPSATGRRD
jgi:DNA-directed RNA polymerase sigma subunit (sigma70/sigma32)